MKNQITEIVRFKINGMYEDSYTVYYKNGTKRKYKINGNNHPKSKGINEAIPFG